MAGNIASLLAPDPADASGLIASQNPLGAPQAVLDYASAPPPVPTPPPTAAQGYSAPMIPAVSAPRTSIPQLAPLAPPAPQGPAPAPWRATSAAAPAPTFQDVRFAGSGASNAPLMDPKAIQAQDAARAGVGQAIGQQYEVGKGIGQAERAEGEAQARGGQLIDVN